MKIYAIECTSNWWDGCNGCDYDIDLLPERYISMEVAEKHKPEDSFRTGGSFIYKVVEQEIIDQ